MEKIFNLKGFNSSDYIKMKNRVAEARSNPQKRLFYTEAKYILKELKKMPKGISILIMLLLALLSISIMTGLIYLYIIRNNSSSFINNLCFSIMMALNILFIGYLLEEYGINRTFKPFKKEFKSSVKYLESEIYEMESYYNTLIHQKYAYMLGNLALNTLNKNNELPISVIKKVAKSIEKHLEEFSFEKT